jgi:hypothetical protein
LRRRPRPHSKTKNLLRQIIAQRGEEQHGRPQVNVLGNDLVTAGVHHLPHRVAQLPVQLANEFGSLFRSGLTLPRWRSGSLFLDWNVSQRGASGLQRFVALALISSALSTFTRAGGDLGLGLETLDTEPQRRDLVGRPTLLAKAHHGGQAGLEVPIRDVEQRLLGISELSIEGSSKPGAFGGRRYCRCNHGACS